jgi:threonine aldolase
MNFRSDNVTGIAPEILTAITAANGGTQASYGEDEITARLARIFADVFEHEVAVFPVVTGTAANALALASLAASWGIISGHAESHVATSECGAPEFFSGGARLVGLAGAEGKIAASTLAKAIARDESLHNGRPAAVSLAQASEAGTLYQAAELADIAGIARGRGLGLHMDGARFANAVAALGCAPAEITWRAGIDVLAFGATKNGALAAEAVVFFDPRQAEHFAFRRKRGGHLLSKMRFLSAQLEAYLREGLWLRNARHANAMAARLAAGVAGARGVRLRYPVEANEVFLELPAAAVTALSAEGFLFYRWAGTNASCIRLVTAFDTAPDAVDAFVAAVLRLTAAA